MLHFQNTIRRCMNAIAILILTNCLMPLITFLVLKWMLGEIFQITIPMPAIRKRRAASPEPEPASAGEEKP